MNITYSNAVPPAPPTRKVEHREYSRGGWTTNIEVAPNGSLAWNEAAYERSLRVRQTEALEKIAARLDALEAAVSRLSTTAHTFIGAVESLHPAAVERRKNVTARLLRDTRRAESLKRATNVWRKAVGKAGTPPADVPPLEAMKFSSRVRKAFRRNDVNTLADLLAKTPDDLMGFHNFGLTSLRDVQTELAEYGLKLADPSDGGVAPDVSPDPAGSRGTLREIAARSEAAGTLRREDTADLGGEGG